jgi:hypothetical protein
MYSVGSAIGDVSGDYDIFVSKNDADGNVVFSDFYDSGLGNDQALEVRIDQSGNIYVVGNIRGGNAIFARKYSSTGTIEYTNIYSSAIVTSTAEAADIQNSTGNLYITGSKTNVVTGEEGNMLLIKYAADGSTDWEVDFDGGSGTSNKHDSGYQLQVDGNGNAYVLGVENALQQSSGFVSLGTPFLRAYNSAGTFIWNRVPAEDGGDPETTLTMETNSNVAVYDWDRKQRYATSNGALNETVYFDDTFLLSGSPTHYKKLSDGGYVRVNSNWIKRYDSGGTLLSSISNGSNYVYSVIMSGDETLYTTGGSIKKYNVSTSAISLAWFYNPPPFFVDFRLTGNNTITGVAGGDSLTLHKLCIPPEIELTQTTTTAGNSLCSGADMALSVDAEYAAGYSWFGNAFGPNSDTTWTGLPFVSNTTVSYLAVDVDAGNGCIMNVEVPAFTNFKGIEAYIVPMEQDCENDPGFLFSLLDANFYEYNWYFDGDQQTFNASSDTILLSPGNGTYTMEVYDTQTGCLSIPSPTHEVTDLMSSDDPSFNYGQAQYCQVDTDPTPTIDGLEGGTFSSSPAGLSLNASDGEIDLSASSPNTYSIQYKTNGLCADSTTVVVQILDPDDAGFSYTSNTFCLTGPDPSPTITGLEGGNFFAIAGTVIDNLSGEIDLSATGIGEYDIAYVTDGNCPSDMEVTINITTAPEADHSYAGAPFCQGDGAILPTFSGNASAGAFSATPFGLSIDEITGEVDPASSTPGIEYTVSNFIAASGGCAQATEVSSVLIAAEDDPSFNYTSNTFCLTGVNPTPTAVTSGTFSGTGGLVVDGVTGQINLTASGVGPYEISHATSGTCPNIGYVNVTVSSAPSALHGYANSPYCDDEGTGIVNYAPGASAGVFSATPAGLVIDAGTGDVNLDTSTPNTYIVTNYIAPSGGCALASENSTIEVLESDFATLSYSSSVYDVTETDPIPTIIGTSGGSFSETTGNIAGNPNTGEIDLSSSTPGGPYLLTYTTPGPCIHIAVFEITITAITGINEYAAKEQISVYPNPTSGLLSIAYAGNSSVSSAMIYEVNGQRVMEFTGHNMDVSHLSAGIYLISAAMKNGTILWTRFVKD